MKIFFVSRQNTELADENSLMLLNTKNAFLGMNSIQEAVDPGEADALIIQEKWSYKDFRYTEILLNDPFLSKYLSKLFTLNFDDCATGLLRGLYSNIPKSRLVNRLHLAVPYMEYYNEKVFDNTLDIKFPKFLVSWRGNTTSNCIRPKLVDYLKSKADCKIEATDSWMNHSESEKNQYVELILNSKFSLCPAGLAPTSFRIYESMALGRCPVIVADDFAPPKGPDWNQFALFYPEREINNIHTFLIEKENEYLKLGQKAKENWLKYFSKDVLAAYYANSFISLIESNNNFSLDRELKRWNSFRFYWSNNWTLPQRVSVKLKKIFNYNG